MSESDHFDDYRTDTTYVVHYAAGICPQLIRFSLMLQGAALPDTGDQPFRYLELGYGFGLGTNIHAAAEGGDFWGADFMAEHAGFASRFAEAAGTGAHMLNKSFEEMDAMSKAGELPQFDMITLHGIWTWVNAENRQHILNIIKRNLKPGGVVYNSYNALPGWSHFMPVRELMLLYFERLDESRSVDDRIRETIAYIQAMAQTDATFFKQNPAARIHLNSLLEMPPKYLAQEYCNRTWAPFYFSEVAATMAEADCSFVSSTSLLSQTGALLPTDTRPVLAAVRDRQFRETLRDYASNARFRSDLFVRDAKYCNSRDHAAGMDAMKVVPIVERDKVELKIQTSYGVIDLNGEVYNAILDALYEGGYTAKSVGDIFSRPQLSDLDLAMRRECLSVLVGKNWASPARSDITPKTMEACHKLNRALCEETVVRGGGVLTLASPVTGGGINVSDIEQNLLYHRPQDETAHEEWVRNVLDSLLRRDLKFDYEKSTRKLMAGMDNFINHRLPFLRAMQVVF